MARLSVAVRPPPDVGALLSALPRPLVSGVRWSRPEEWIVKVRPLGQVADSVVPRLIEALRAELSGAPAVDCVLGPETRRIGGDWLGAPVNGLDVLAAGVFEATADLVPVTHPQPFHADVVLARGRVPKELAGVPISGAWTARSVALVADRSSPQARRLENVVVFRLCS
ncbi:MAG: 2'-5' RNA ligase family protein [Jiangellaceae bacterium]